MHIMIMTERRNYYDEIEKYIFEHVGYDESTNLLECQSVDGRIHYISPCEVLITGFTEQPQFTYPFK